MYEDVKEYLNWYDTRKDMTFAADAPVIGLVLQRSHLVTGDEGHYSGVVSEMESLGAKVGPAMHATQPMHTQSTHYGSNSLRVVSPPELIPNLQFYFVALHQQQPQSAYLRHCFGWTAFFKQA